MILDLSKDFIFNYNKHVSTLISKFDQIIKNKSEENVFMAISVALRIAAKLSRKYGFDKEAFMDAASGNFDLENGENIEYINIKQTDYTLN